MYDMSLQYENMDNPVGSPMIKKLHKKSFSYFFLE